MRIAVLLVAQLRSFQQRLHSSLSQILRLPRPRKPGRRWLVVANDTVPLTTAGMAAA